MSLWGFFSSPPPCEKDQDGDGYGDGSYCKGSDCDDTNPFVWERCGACTDDDHDNYWIGCDSYVKTDENHLGRDCDDTNPFVWRSCSNCEDIDGDNYWQNCDGYQVTDENHLGEDCDESSPLCNVECVDRDNDGRYDCKENCIDNDSDGYGEGRGCLGSDICDSDTNNWSQDGCQNCTDSDNDGYFVNCDRYQTIQGPDCDETFSNCTTDCSDSDQDNIFDCKDSCIDVDGDNYGQGTRCSGTDNCDIDTNNWSQNGCQNCRDSDNDGYFVNCDRYHTIQGPDCEDNSSACTTDCSDSNNDGNRDCCLRTPRIVGSYDTPGFAWGVYVQGSYAYVADFGSGLQIIDISNPRNPFRLGSYDTPGDAYGVYVQGSYAYVADGSSGLQIIGLNCQ